MPKTAWMAFCVFVPILIFFYLNAWLLISTKFIMWRNEVIFLNRKNLIFSVVAGCIWFVCFRLKIFTSKISNLLLPLGVLGPEPRGPRILINLSKEIRILFDMEYYFVFLVSKSTLLLINELETSLLQSHIL